MLDKCKGVLNVPEVVGPKRQGKAGECQVNV